MHNLSVCAGFIGIDRVAATTRGEANALLDRCFSGGEGRGFCRGATTSRNLRPHTEWSINIGTDSVEEERILADKGSSSR